MKKLIFCCCCSLVLFCCNVPEKKTVQKINKSSFNGFELNGTLNSYLSDKVYLNKIIDLNYYPIDSALIKNNEFTFKGIVEYPERFALTFENYSNSLILILENTNFEININPISLQEALISDSPLNSKLENYKNKSKNIFKKIESLFPRFQKARLENDAEKLAEIVKKMNTIEDEFQEYTYHFIKNNSDSFVSVMILRDQLKSSKIDTIRVKEAYYLLSENVKQCPDAHIIETTLNLH